MSTQSTGDILADRMAQFKNQQSLTDQVRVFEPPKTPAIIIKPAAPTWEALETKLETEKLINLPGLWITVRELYEQGFGAELLTLAEIVLATHKKENPYNMFATSVSKKSGNWETKTLKTVRETWEVRRNALEVVERLKFGDKSVKAILALAWRLKGTCAISALLQSRGTGIKNPTGLFFALTKKPKPQPA